MKWFRFYSDALDDPKVQRLPAELFRAWVNILCLASRHGGTLPPVEDIQFALRLSADAVAVLLADLKAHGLIDETDAGMAPHNWNKRQYKSDNVTLRVQKNRAHCNVSVTPNETFHGTPTETDTETETENTPLPPKKAAPKPKGKAVARDPFEPETYEQFNLRMEQERPEAVPYVKAKSAKAEDPVPYERKIWLTIIDGGVSAALLARFAAAAEKKAEAARPLLDDPVQPPRPKDASGDVRDYRGRRVAHDGIRTFTPAPGWPCAEDGMYHWIDPERAPVPWQDAYSRGMEAMAA
jgi:hypothetical protein